jgi:hypothetical protein
VRVCGCGGNRAPKKAHNSPLQKNNNNNNNNNNQSLTPLHLPPPPPLDTQKKINTPKTTQRNQPPPPPQQITAMRVEVLGTGFTAQHSDARVLDQLLYKWAHSRRVIGEVRACVDGGGLLWLWVLGVGVCGLYCGGQMLVWLSVYSIVYPPHPPYPKPHTHTF